MTQLRLAYVNVRLVNSMKRFSSRRADSRKNSLPSFARKALELQQRKPHAAALVEKLVDDLLSEIAILVLLLAS